MKISKNKPGFDRAKFEAMSDEEIEATSPPELANLPDDFFDAPGVVVRPAREAISLRVDPQVLDFFRKDGPGYQSRMNAVLRRYVDGAAAKWAAAGPKWAAAPAKPAAATHRWSDSRRPPATKRVVENAAGQFTGPAKKKRAAPKRKKA